MKIFNSAATCARQQRQVVANAIRISKLRRIVTLTAIALLSCACVAAQNPLETLRKAAEAQAAKAKQEAATKSFGSILNNQLPLTLDANTTYPTVATLPGGPFQPKLLKLTAADLDRPLPPGDYTIQIFAFCTEYSVHRPGYGTAYELAPIRGKASGAISQLLWRGNLRGKSPQQLQAVSWAIQSGLRYTQMPKTYQAVIDELIPDYKTQLDGDFMQSLQDAYQGVAKSAGLPPLDKVLAGMGKPGELALSAERQRAALLRANTTDQIREQVLFQGQDAGVYTPARAIDGPWTERIPGVAYLRYKIIGGNMAANNIMEVRILPQSGTVAANSQAPRLINARFVTSAPRPQSASPSPSGLIGASIGYPVGAGAQDLVPVPVLSAASPAPSAGGSCSNGKNSAGQPCIGTITSISGNATVIHPDGTTSTLNSGDTVNMGDKLQTSANSHIGVDFADDTQLSLSENSSLVVDNYVYDPQSHSSAGYSFLAGAFQYVSGLIAKKDPGDVNIQTPYGGIGIRGTEFTLRCDPQSNRCELDLIHGSVAVTSKQSNAITTITAPTALQFDAARATKAALTQAQYDAVLAKIQSGQTPQPVIHE